MCVLGYGLVRGGERVGGCESGLVGQVVFVYVMLGCVYMYGNVGVCLYGDGRVGRCESGLVERVVFVLFMLGCVHM